MGRRNFVPEGLANGALPARARHDDNQGVGCSSGRCKMASM